MSITYLSCNIAQQLPRKYVVTLIHDGARSGADDGHLRPAGALSSDVGATSPPALPVSLPCSRIPNLIGLVPGIVSFEGVQGYSMYQQAAREA